MSTISVCIATHERAHLLRPTLEALARQDCLPDEIIVSDSSASAASEEVTREFARTQSRIHVRHVHSERRALPWQRWWAFSHSSGEIILFLDDDVSLEPETITILKRVYLLEYRPSHAPLVGVGLLKVWDDYSLQTRRRGSLKERLIGTAAAESGRAIPGGLAASLDGPHAANLIRVDRFWGGAMSFRREVLQRIGLLDQLVELYESGLGRGEDAVLSFYARQQGELCLITLPLALHPRPEKIRGTATPYSTSAWRMGLSATWGRAHTLRWTATSQTAYRQSCLRMFLLELGRASSGVIRRPGQRAAWLRLLGAGYGCWLTLSRWNAIPARARSAAYGEKQGS
jgi:GT2 family glycosyltransferase